MPEPRNIVILGASYAGLGQAHYLLKHVLPRLPLTDGKAAYKIVLVDASSKWFVRHTSPRAAASEKLIPYDKIFLDIEPGFKHYGDAFEFVQGKATAWDSEGRTITLVKPSSGSVALPYYALILATGSKTYSPLFSAQADGYQKTEAALEALHKQLATARSIVITGGGPTTVEAAGELGEYLNGAAGWFTSRPADPQVSITLITNSAKLLPQLRTSIAQQAEGYLNRVGVDVRYETKVSTTHTGSNGKTTIVLHGGEEIETDIYIPAIGVQPLSEYVPAELKDEKGYVVQNSGTLRVDAAGTRVYAVGDVGTASRNGLLDILDQTPVLALNIKRDLLAAHTNTQAKPEGEDRIFKPNLTETQLVPVGRSKGVGAVFGYRIPSFLVWLIKGRDFMISAAQDTVDGGKWKKEVAWKGE